jgi:hypothetical protein
MACIRKKSAETVTIFSSFSYKNIPKICKNFISGGEDVYDQAVSPLGPETRNIPAETEIFPSLARISFRVQNLRKEIGNTVIVQGPETSLPRKEKFLKR